MLVGSWGGPEGGDPGSGGPRGAEVEAWVFSAG